MTVATYVGYDDNTSMRRGSLRLQGSNGALPAWLETVRGMAHAGVLGPTAGGEYLPSPGLEAQPVSPTTGLPGTGMTTLSTLGPRAERLFSPHGLPAVTLAPAVEVVPSGAVAAPSDLEFGPPEPEEGVDPALAPPQPSAEPSLPTTIPELEGGFELPPGSGLSTPPPAPG
jgi:hypothetical protein